jgi:hypothetical protein
VADYPQLQFAFSDVQFGLRVDERSLRVVDELTVHSADLTDARHTASAEVVEHAQARRQAQVEVNGGGAARVANLTVPLSYAGRHEQRSTEESWRYQSTYSVSTERLQQVARHYERHVRQAKDVTIKADAGYFKGAMAVSSSHPCRLEALSVNIKVNGRVLWTRPVKADGQLPLDLGRRRGEPDTVALAFEGINTEEMAREVLQREGVQITFEVPLATVRLSEFADPEKYRKALASVQGRCVLVETVRGGRAPSCS